MDANGRGVFTCTNGARVDGPARPLKPSARPDLIHRVDSPVSSLWCLITRTIKAESGVSRRLDAAYILPRRITQRTVPNVVRVALAHEDQRWERATCRYFGQTRKPSSLVFWEIKEQLPILLRLQGASSRGRDHLVLSIALFPAGLLGRHRAFAGM